MVKYKDTSGKILFNPYHVRLGNNISNTVGDSTSKNSNDDDFNNIAYKMSRESML